MSLMTLSRILCHSGDRRKGPQLYIFWISVVVLVLTIFFGVIKSVKRDLQAYLVQYREFLMVCYEHGKYN